MTQVRIIVRNPRLCQQIDWFIMSQLCTIKSVASRDRWPKPLEHHKADIDLLITSAHDEYAAYQILKQADNATKPPESLLEPLRLLATVLEDLEEGRQGWWTSPEKRALRKRLEEECDQKKLTELHKINNGTVERIEAMSAKLGQFVKWSLGMNGGIWELKEGVKVGQ